MGGGGACESCAMCRDQMSDDKKQFLFLLVVSGDFRHSMRIPQEVGSHLRSMISEFELVKLDAPDGHRYPVEVSRELGAVVLRSGWHEFVNANHIEEDYSILFVYRWNSIFKVHIFDSSGHEKSSSCSLSPSGMFGAVPPRAPCDHYVLNEQMVPDPGHVQSSNDIVYTTLPGCCLTKAQDEKVLEIADTKKSEIPLHVTAMNKRNVSLKDSCVYIPLPLVRNYFKEEVTKPTIQLEAPDSHIYSVGASKYNNDQVVLDSGWDTFVVAQRLQEKDLLIFRSTEKSRLEVLILDPSGHEKTSCFAMGNSSSTHETSGDSVHIVGPPPPTLIDLSSSDDDDIVRKDNRKSSGVQKRVTRSRAKTQKMASTSSPSTKSGYEGRKTHDRAPMKLDVGSEPLSNNLGDSNHHPYLLSKGTTLSSQVEKIVEEKVQEFRSEHPIFVRVMSTCNVDGIASSTCQMAFCMEYALACLPDKRQTLFLQLEGKKKLWETMFEVQSNKVRRIYKGWKEFSQDNALEVGDICLFKLEDTNTSSLKMTVYLIRKSPIEL